MRVVTRIRTTRVVDRAWINREIGKRLRALRKANGYTLQDVAVALGVTRAAVNNWELAKSQKNFIVGTLYDLALFYKVPIRRLMP